MSARNARTLAVFRDRGATEDRGPSLAIHRRSLKKEGRAERRRFAKCRSIREAFSSLTAANGMTSRSVGSDSDVMTSQEDTVRREACPIAKLRGSLAIGI
jgi:hypothetical protein